MIDQGDLRVFIVDDHDLVRAGVASQLADVPGIRVVGEAANVDDAVALLSTAAADVVSVIRAGARGYVTKAVSAGELIEAIRRVASGDAAFSPRLAGFVLDAFGVGAGDVAERDEELDRLSEREQEVMRLIARG